MQYLRNLSCIKTSGMLLCNICTVSMRCQNLISRAKTRDATMQYLFFMWLETVLEGDTPNIIKPFYETAQNIILSQSNYESTALRLVQS